MGQLESAERVGLRDKETEKLIAVYPEKPTGTDAEITKTVMDWYYQQSCGAEEKLRHAYVDSLTDQEIKSHR